MRTPASREQPSRDELLHSTDLTDAEWALIAPLPPPASRVGRPRLWSLRGIVNGIIDVLRGGVPRCFLPKDLSPKSTAYGCFGAWRHRGPFAGIDRHFPSRCCYAAWLARPDFPDGS